MKTKLIYHTVFLFLIVGILLAASVPAYAWKMPIEISIVSDDGAKIYNKIVVGIESGATDGFDNLWDTPAMLSHPDPDVPILLMAYVKGDYRSGEDKGRLWKDIRGARSSGDTIWEITIESVPSGRSVVLNWTGIPVGVLKTGERLVLKDNGKFDSNGEPVATDISQTESYTFEAIGNEPRSLSIVLSGQAANKSSGGGSGFGCGTVKLYGDGFTDGGSSFMNFIVLVSPLILLRWLRGRRSPAITGGWVKG